MTAKERAELRGKVQALLPAGWMVKTQQAVGHEKVLLYLAPDGATAGFYSLAACYNWLKAWRGEH